MDVEDTSQGNVDAQLTSLVEAMDEFEPVIPSEVIEYFLEKGGFHSSDEDVVKLVNVATQKFVTDLVNDSVHFTRIREQRESGRTRTKVSHKRIMKTEDVQQALAQIGISVNKPDYFADSANVDVEEEEEEEQ